MSSLIGQAEVSIDAKSRLPIPAKFRVEPRDDAPSAADGPRPVWISTPRADGTLWLFPDETFSTLASSLDQNLSPDEDLAELNRVLFGYSERITEDAAHRLTLPRKHLELVGLQKDVTLVGTLNHLEVHDRAEWLAREAERLKRLPDLSARLAARLQARRGSDDR